MRGGPPPGNGGARCGIVEEALPGRLAGTSVTTAETRHGGLRRDDGVNCRTLTPIIMSARRRLSEDIKPHTVITAELRIAHGRSCVRVEVDVLGCPS